MAKHPTDAWTAQSELRQITTTVRGVPMTHLEAGTGYPLVLLHGGGGTGKAFWYQLEGLSSQFRVLAPDLPGHGGSAWMAGVETVDDLGPVLLDWMAGVGLERAVLGGNSMGGRVATAAAIRCPDRLSHLVLLDAVAVLIEGLAPKNPLDIPPDRYLMELVHDPDHYRRTTPYRTMEDAEALNRGRDAFRRYMSASPMGPDRTEVLPRLTMPILLIWGRHDQIVPVEYGRVLAARVPTAELTVIENAGHLPHIETPGIVNHLLLDFLERHPTPA
ncbi:MAG: alpha/beta fold hydrolase [Thermaerobacter sp.]|nr:alpha/beta fold hydrolase [Thermaerobacter sp.]